MRETTDKRPVNQQAQKKRRNGAWLGACVATAIFAFSGTLLLILRAIDPVEGAGNYIVLIFALMNYGTIIPVWILLKVRLKEIEGGEEDAATEY